MPRVIGNKISRGPALGAAIRVKPTKIDETIADFAARTTKPSIQTLGRGLSWGADEKVWLALSAVGWIISRGQARPVRRAASHALLVTVAVSALPHLLKSMFNQTRPDRETVRGHLNGVQRSGHAEDAFPSGHALHMGALYSAASTLPAAARIGIRSAALGLCATRILILAHWASDVAVGFMIGALVERGLRLWTGYGQDGASRR
ncbi:membrane-associated phospholipid phosphatase [Bradyrhizobium sp. USDA 4353]